MQATQLFTHRIADMFRPMTDQDSSVTKAMQIKRAGRVFTVVPYTSVKAGKARYVVSEPDGQVWHADTLDEVDEWVNLRVTAIEELNALNQKFLAKLKF